MIAAATPHSGFSPGRAGAMEGGAPALTRIVSGADYLLLYFIIFTACGAVYRYGGVNTYLWYAIYVWTAARLSLELPALANAVSRNWQVFVWPALAIASVAWSLAPAVSLRGGTQLLMTTLIAVFIGSRFSLRAILMALTVVLMLTAMFSLAMLYSGTPEAYNESGGFRGTFAHKNTLGLRMNILLAAAFVLALAARGRVLAYVAAAAVSGYVLVLSQSATSQILALMTPVIIIAMLAFRHGTRTIFMTASAFAGAAAAFGVAALISNVDPVGLVLDSFGKDATLTGRTWLWDIGLAEIRKHPIIGGGYQAFWANTQGNEVLQIRHVLIDSVNGFHNVGVEVWNDLGLPGLAALFGVLFLYARRAFLHYCVARSPLDLFPLFFLIIVIVSAAVNNSFFRQHELVHVLLCALFAATSPLNRHLKKVQATGRSR
jgi:O-antigen ligase